MYIYTCITQIHTSVCITQFGPGHCPPGDWQIATQLLETMQMWRLTVDVVTVNSSWDPQKWWICTMGKVG